MAERAALPDWPRRMDADLAASYLSVSKTTFLQRVAKRAYPSPKREGKRVLWDRRLLDRFVDAQFGIANNTTSDNWDDIWAASN